MRLRVSNLAFLVIFFLLVRVILYANGYDVYRLGYWTLVGRIDQFLFGMLAFCCASSFKNKHAVMAVLSTGFLLIFWFLDIHQVFFNTKSWNYPVAWIFVPFIEGAFYAVLIAWYDQSFSMPDKGVSRVVARIGKYSYSINLLHFFVVFYAAKFIHQHIMDLSSFYVALPWSVACFFLMLIPGHISYKLIERPFLRHRKPYIREQKRPLLKKKKHAFA